MTLTAGNKIDAARDPRRQPLVSSQNSSTTPLLPVSHGAQIKPSNLQSPHMPQQRAFVNGTTSLFIPKKSSSSSRNSPTERAASAQTAPHNYSDEISAQIKECHPLIQCHPLIPTDPAKFNLTDKHEAGLPGRKRRISNASLRQPRTLIPSKASFGSPGISLSPGPQKSAADAVALMSKVPVKKYPSPTKQNTLQAARPFNNFVGSAQVVESEMQASFVPRFREPVAPRPRPLEADTSERMARDVETELEYVKGQGAVIIRHASATTTNNVQMTRPVIPDDEQFPVNYCWNNIRFITLEYVKWVASVDGFEINLGGGEKMVVHAEAVSRILYNLQCRKFCLLPNKDIGPEKRLQELVLEVGGDEKTPFKLRSLFERRFGATKVSPVEVIYFVNQEISFKKANLYAVPPRSISQPDTTYRNVSDDLSDGVLEDLNLLFAGNGNRQQAIQALGLLDNTNIPERNALEVEYDDTSPVSLEASPAAASDLTIHKKEAISVESSKAQQEESALGHIRGPKKIDLATYKQRQKLKNHAMIVCPENMPPGEQQTESRVKAIKALVLEHNENPRDSSPTRMVVGNNAKSTSTSLEANSIISKTHTPDPPETDFMGLRYKSGQPVRLNDLVIRIRDMETIDSGKNKFDKLDIYDGPFRVTEIPEDDPGKLLIGSQTSGEEVKKDQIRAMQEKLVRLQFPRGTQANSWTKLGRLRPVFRVPLEVSDELDARTTYYWGRDKGIASTIMNTEKMWNEEDDTNDNRGVCHIQSHTYVKVRYVATDGSDGGDEYEVEKLRGKIIEIHSRRKFPMERMDDPAIVKYFADGNSISEKEVLVVKYLIHWAGWPSEDDTYELAQDNIPQVLIDAYNKCFKPDDIGLDTVAQSSLPEHARKRRKSGAKRYVST